MTYLSSNYLSVLFCRHYLSYTRWVRSMTRESSPRWAGTSPCYLWSPTWGGFSSNHCKAVTTSMMIDLTYFLILLILLILFLLLILLQPTCTNATSDYSHLDNSQHECLSEITTICAMLSAENIWVRPSRPGGGLDKKNNKPMSSAGGGQEQSRIQLNISTNHFPVSNNTGYQLTGSDAANEYVRAEQAHQQLRHPYGDFHTCLHVYHEWERHGFTQKWCDRNYINHRAMKSVRSIR